MNNDNAPDLLKELRKDLDEIDLEICQLIEERLDICLEIAKAKRSAGLPLENREREQQVLSACKRTVPRYPSQISYIFETVIQQSKLTQRKKFNLYLVGMPNSGKSRLSYRLGVELHRRSIDTDSLIMKQERRSIDELFDTYGERYFRELEHNALLNVARLGNLVVATGGGVLTYPLNQPILKNSGVTVFLDRSPESLYRAKIKNRPLIREGEEAVRKLYEERLEQYRSFADLTVDPDSPEAIGEIVSFFLSAIS